MCRWALAAGCAFLFAGCSNNGNVPSANPDARRGGDAGTVRSGDAGREGGGGVAGAYSFGISGGQVVPRLQSAGSATATLVVSPDKSQIDVALVVSNLGGLTGAAIQVGEVGANGPAIFILSTQAFTNPLKVTLKAADLQANAASGISTFADAVQAISTGMAYLVVKTQNAPQGELRGQIGTVTLDSPLSADQIVAQPAITSNASATATVVVAPDQQSMAVSLTPSNVVGSTGAFIYAGGPGQNGPVIFKITTQALTGPVTVTLKAADLTPQPAQNISSFANAVDAVLAGLTYVSINTSIHPNGELRGHVGRISFTPNLSGQQVVPPVSTTNNAAAEVTIPNSRKDINVYVNAYGATNLTGATINLGAPGSNGPPIFVVASGAIAPNTVVSKMLQPTDLQLQSGSEGISSFADAIQAIITGKTYLLITSTDFPNGFLRGQIGGGY